MTVIVVFFILGRINWIFGINWIFRVDWIFGIDAGIVATGARNIIVAGVDWSDPIRPTTGHVVEDRFGSAEEWKAISRYRITPDRDFQTRFESFSIGRESGSDQNRHRYSSQ